MKKTVILISGRGSNMEALIAARAAGALPVDIAAVISYAKNNWSNKTGQVVQPADVLAQRK